MVDGPFLMSVEDVFCLRQGRVVMVSGRIERGRLRKGDAVEIVGSGGGATHPVEGIERNQVYVDEASADANVGVLLSGAAVGVVERGRVLAAPGSVFAYGGFVADIALLSEEAGGADVVSGDRLLFFIRTAAVWGIVTLPEGTGTLRPLHGSRVSVALDGPVALEPGQSFAFRHHGRAAGSGTVTRLPR
ncbi:EF-Tu/IF-2/RF-3 family GTPase [Streptomyces sp. NPDC094032]|uniref:EF-Tu/IF-2/RF-3 family GTPase n=1 Tax=Streptomyces sp. NPDC094032 TaxID=3155308 RepID=UPI003331C014